jgi:hypothetical protein
VPPDVVKVGFYDEKHNLEQMDLKYGKAPELADHMTALANVRKWEEMQYQPKTQQPRAPAGVPRQTSMATVTTAFDLSSLDAARRQKPDMAIDWVPQPTSTSVSVSDPVTVELMTPAASQALCFGAGETDQVDGIHGGNLAQAAIAVLSGEAPWQSLQPEPLVAHLFEGDSSASMLAGTTLMFYRERSSEAAFSASNIVRG